MNERKREIWNKCEARAKETAKRIGVSSWSDQIDKVITPEERKEVKALWDTMPGTTCFADAFLRWLNTPKPEEVRSYYVNYHSTDCKPLIGDVMKAKSSRFGRKSEAELRMSTILKYNKNCFAEVLASDEYPEIFPHCKGATSQVLGGKCFACGQLVTIQDAMKYSPEPAQDL